MLGEGGGGLLKFRANTAFKINVFRLCSWQIELLKFLRLAFPLEELHVTLLAETEESQCLGEAPPYPPSGLSPINQTRRTGLREGWEGERGAQDTVETGAVWSRKGSPLEHTAGLAQNNKGGLESERQGLLPYAVP